MLFDPRVFLNWPFIPGSGEKTQQLIGHLKKKVLGNSATGYKYLMKDIASWRLLPEVNFWIKSFTCKEAAIRGESHGPG